MKTVILAGGRGTRLNEETDRIPKPLIEIGGRPILWHIMKLYSFYGFSDFIVCTGYKGEQVSEYASKVAKENGWQVEAVDTGLEATTGERMMALEGTLAGETFMLTYGDGVADVNIGHLIKFHREHGRVATLTGVHPPARYGAMILDGAMVTNFEEKAPLIKEFVSGGFYVFGPRVFDYQRSARDTRLEWDTMRGLARDRELMCFFHQGFWRGVDTYRDYLDMNAAWEESRPWALWES